MGVTEETSEDEEQERKIVHWRCAVFVISHGLWLKVSMILETPVFPHALTNAEIRARVDAGEISRVVNDPCPYVAQEGARLLGGAYCDCCH